jgi:hypothetical protein
VALRTTKMTRRGKNETRRIGATRQEVNRLTNLKHASKIDRIDAAIRVLGGNSNMLGVTDGGAAGGSSRPYRGEAASRRIARDGGLTG